jgi:hypothetical protein
LESMWKNKGLMSRGIHICFLFPLTSIHVKRGGGLTFWFPLVSNHCNSVNSQPQKYAGVQIMVTEQRPVMSM